MVNSPSRARSAVRLLARLPGETRTGWNCSTQVSDCGGDFIRAHASGHIYVADLVELVTALNAKTVVPIHTFEPHLFHTHFPNVTRLVDGVPFVVT